ncbi:MAG TPA: hypothetical protein VKN76_00515 [Kiloniellaceae bacterium]|nr:hypothetical protein [Kiloniellaceae bacterium]
MKGFDGASPEHIHMLRVEQLRMIQSIITRMAGNSGMMKRYFLILALAVVGISSAQEYRELILFAMAVSAIFACLDGAYLALERRYRMLYDRVRNGDWSEPPDFSLAIDKEIASKARILPTIFSWSVFWLYGLVIILLAMIYYYPRL